MKIRKSMLFVFICIALSGCKKNDDDVTPNEEAIPTNLSANLTVESNRIAAEEGKSIIINLNLDKAFSEDLLLEGTFTTDGITNYVNDGDLKQEFSYSVDLGATWQTENDPTQVKFVKGKVNLKVKIETVDDPDKELLLEETKVTFASKTPSLMTGDESLEVQIGVLDDEFTEAPDDANILMLFTFDANNEYSIQAITSSLNSGTAEKAKAIIDGEYVEIMEDIKYANTLLPQDARIENFELLLLESGLGGYVYNSSDDDERSGNINNFSMGLNLLFAYFNEDGEPFATTYNEAGQYGIILAHELGHVITLARKTQVDASIAEGDCTRLFDIEGCVLEKSYLNNLDSAFYTPGPEAFPAPFHVSEYASSSIYEDIAEVIATYVTQDDIPALSDQSSGALQKVHQILGYDALKTFKQGFRARIKTAFDNLNNGPVSKSQKKGPVFNKFDDKFVPCSHLKKVQ